MPKLVLVSGPSCVGKSPLAAGLGRLAPDLAGRIEKLVLYTDREKRPGEEDGVDYHFRARDEIAALKDDPDHVVIDNRGDLQALERAAIDRILGRGCHALYEGSPRLPAALRRMGVLDDYDTLSVFLSPLSRAEVRHARQAGLHLPELFAEIQRRKLLHRTERQQGWLSLGALEDIETRARSAYGECREACRFDHVNPLHDGEGHDNWDRFGIPIGSARAAIARVVALIAGEVPEGVECWDDDLLP